LTVRIENNYFKINFFPSSESPENFRAERFLSVIPS
jgi:hypothetical protein